VAHDGAVPLVLAATPIGNVGDASARLREALATADVVAAEDTRRLSRLAAALGVTVAGRIVSFYDAVEAARTPALLADLSDGRTVLLVSDAGTPLVSDPGHRLVAAAVEAGVDVTVLPGPSAVLAAIAVAGLPADRWCFEGFLPRRAGERRRRLAELGTEPRTLVFFEAPHRLAAMLADVAGAFGADRPAAVCRELTKTYEEVRRGALGELAQWATGEVRGEIVVVVAGASASNPAAEIDDATLAAAVAVLVAGGLSRRDAVDQVAAEHGIPRRRVYSAAT
jgi:16S rRNA (cytidine1402-2'-O)-methyltransferase